MQKAKNETSWALAYVAVNMLLLTAFWMYRANLNYYIFSMGGEQFDISLAESAYFLPSLLFAIVGGVLADKTSKLFLWLLLFSLAHIVILSAVALAVNFFSLSVHWIIVLTFFLGTVGALRNSPSAVFVRVISSQEEIIRVNSLLSASFNFARIVGPLATAGLSGVISVKSIFITLPIISLPFLLYFVVLLFIFTQDRGLAEPKGKSTSGIQIRNLLAGYWWFLAAVAGFFFCVNLLWTTLPYLLDGTSGVVLQLYSSAYAVFGFGAIFGSLIQPKLYRSRGVSVCFLLGTISYGLFYCVALIAPGAWVLLGVFSAGIGMGLFFSSISTHILLTAEEFRQGRLLAAATILTNGLLAVGSIVLSWLASRMSNEVSYLVAILILLLVVPFAAQKIGKLK